MGLSNLLESLINQLGLEALVSPKNVLSFGSELFMQACRRKCNNFSLLFLSDRIDLLWISALGSFKGVCIMDLKRGCFYFQEHKIGSDAGQHTRSKAW